MRFQFITFFFAALVAARPGVYTDTNAEVGGPAKQTVEISYVRIVQEHSCSIPGYYCFQNGVDWAGCNLELKKVTNDIFKVNHSTTKCTPGQWVGPLRTVDFEDSPL